MDFFALNVKYLRKIKGVSQAETASSIGCGQSSWSEYENGSSKPVFNDLLKIIEYFNISASDLLERDLSKGNLIEKRSGIEKHEKVT
jgi:transcriptional regulator with XRE-family HTH domain